MKAKRLLSTCLIIALIVSTTACTKKAKPVTSAVSNGSEQSAVASADVSAVSGQTSTGSTVSGIVSGKTSSGNIKINSKGGSSSSKKGTSSGKGGSSTNSKAYIPTKNSNAQNKEIQNNINLRKTSTRITTGLNFQGKTFVMARAFDDSTSFKREINAFQKKYNCNLKIENLGWDNYLQAYASKLASGEKIDIGYMHSSFYPNTIIAGLCEPVETTIGTADLYDKNNLSTGGIDFVKSNAFSWSNHMYGLTGYKTNVPMLFYNKQMFKDAGLPDPYDLYKTGKWSYQALQNLAERAYEPSKGLYIGSKDIWEHDYLIFNNEGYQIVMKNNKVVENLTDNKVYNGYVYQKGLIGYLDPKGSGGSDASEFIAGNTYMFAKDSAEWQELAPKVLSSTAFNKTLSNVGYVPIPFGQDNTDKKYYIGGLNAFTAGKGTSDKRAAAAFAMFDSNYKDPVKDTYTLPNDMVSLDDTILTGNVQWDLGGFRTTDTYVPGICGTMDLEIFKDKKDIKSSFEKYRSQIQSCINTCVNAQ